MGFVELLVLLLVAFKLAGITQIGWLTCFAPFLFYPVAFVGMAAFVVVAGLLGRRARR